MMGKNGLLDIGIVSFVFTPLALTIALLICIWWNRIKESRALLPLMDTPGLLLNAAVRRMQDEQREWGAAMMAELSQIQGFQARWWFAMGCFRVALFPPQRSGLPSPNPTCGILAIMLPPLGLPFLYFTVLIMETLLKQEGVSLSESYPDFARTIRLISLSCILAGLPLGIAGLLRHERLRKLSLMGMLSSLCIIGYFLIVMGFMAGGPNGD